MLEKMKGEKRSKKTWVQRCLILITMKMYSKSKMKKIKSTFHSKISKEDQIKNSKQSKKKKISQKLVELRA